MKMPGDGHAWKMDVPEDAKDGHTVLGPLKTDIPKLVWHIGR